MNTITIYNTGIGYATTIVCFLLNIYYIVILAWTFHYFCNSFTTTLPWSSCGNWWNTDNCFVPNSTTGNVSNNKRVDSVVEYWE